MGAQGVFSVVLVTLALLAACGPHQFERSTTSAGQSEGFEAVDGGTSSESRVIVSSEQDEAWDGVDTEGGDDWYEGDEEKR